MPDLTTPAASSIAPPVTVAPPLANAPGVPSLAAFIDLMIGKITPPAPKGATADRDRQDDAATGNGLPDKGKDVDPALAWLFGAMTLPTPIPASPTAPSPPVTAETAENVAPDVPAAPGTAPAASEAAVQQGRCEVVFGKPGIFTPPVAPPGVTPTNQPDTAPQPIGLPLVPTRLPVDQPDPISQPIRLPLVPTRLPANQPDAAPQPIRLPLVPTRLPADAGANPVPLAAALPALFALSMTSERANTGDDPVSSLTPGITPLSPTMTAMPIAPMADAQRQALDMGRQDWPQKMIDHIEALRDNANANDTSIRLKPEALGRVDIALKTHDDGAISVRFTAEQPTTRTLLVDATPQLSAAADARGIRLSGTSVDLSGQGDPRPQPQTDRAQPTINRLATPRGDDNQAVDDGRIA